MTDVTKIEFIRISEPDAPRHEVVVFNDHYYNGEIAYEAGEKTGKFKVSYHDHVLQHPLRSIVSSSIDAGFKSMHAKIRQDPGYCRDNSESYDLRYQTHKRINRLDEEWKRNTVLARTMIFKVLHEWRECVIIEREVMDILLAEIKQQSTDVLDGVCLHDRINLIAMDVVIVNQDVAECESNRKKITDAVVFRKYGSFDLLAEFACGVGSEIERVDAELMRKYLDESRAEMDKNFEREKELNRLKNWMMIPKTYIGF